MRVIIAGGRDFNGTEKHKKWLINQLKKVDATEVVCGMARGADMFGYYVAANMGLKVAEYPALWDKYGKSAGYRRNETMADNADICILFPGGKGTGHMKDIATKKGLMVIEYEQQDTP